MFVPEFQVWCAHAYGADFQWALRERYLVRIMGSFVFVIGTLSCLAARSPLKSEIVVWALVEFFILRNIHRHYYGAELQSGFGVSSQVNNLTSVLFSLLALVLALTLVRTKSQKP